jgi:hypothetical protein
LVVVRQLSHLSYLRFALITLYLATDGDIQGKICDTE